MAVNIPDYLENNPRGPVELLTAMAEEQVQRMVEHSIRAGSLLYARSYLLGTRPDASQIADEVSKMFDRLEREVGPKLAKRVADQRPDAPGYGFSPN